MTVKFPEKRAPLTLGVGSSSAIDGRKNAVAGELEQARPVSGAWVPPAVRQRPAAAAQQGVVAPNAAPRIQGEPSFGALTAAVQERVLACLDRHAKDPEASEILTRAVLTPGFALLKEDVQLRLLQQVGGTHPALSVSARTALGKLLEGKIPKFVGSELFATASAKSQRGALEGFTQTQPGLTKTASMLDRPAGAGAHYDLRGPLSDAQAATEFPALFKAGTKIRDHDFKSGGGTPLLYAVEIEGRRVPIWVASPPDKKVRMHTADEAAQAVASLPTRVRELITSVSLNRKEGEETGSGRAYMSVDWTKGNVNVFAIDPKYASQAEMNGSLLHEAGHALFGKEWGPVGNPRWQPWSEAMTSDGLSASQYAKTAMAEDVAESLVLYQSVIGTSDEAEVRALLPGRFKLLDQVLAAYREGG